MSVMVSHHGRVSCAVELDVHRRCITLLPFDPSLSDVESFAVEVRINSLSELQMLSFWLLSFQFPAPSCDQTVLWIEVVTRRRSQV